MHSTKANVISFETIHTLVCSDSNFNWWIHKQAISKIMNTNVSTNWNKNFAIDPQSMSSRSYPSRSQFWMGFSMFMRLEVAIRREKFKVHENCSPAIVNFATVKRQITARVLNKIRIRQQQNLFWSGNFSRNHGEPHLKLPNDWF